MKTRSEFHREINNLRTELSQARMENIALHTGVDLYKALNKHLEKVLEAARVYVKSDSTDSAMRNQAALEEAIFNYDQEGKL